MLTPLTPQPMVHFSSSSMKTHTGQTENLVQPIGLSESEGILRYACYDPGSEGVSSPAAPPRLMSIDLERLENFELVTDQYHEQGVRFINAIALQPSNPAFPTRTSDTILMAGPKAGLIEIVFDHPVQTVEAYITSSTATVMTAFDSNNEIIDRVETVGSNLAGDTTASHAPHARLHIHRPQSPELHPPKKSSGKSPGNSPEPCPEAVLSIRRVLLRCLGGQLTLTDFSFGI